MPLAQPVPDPVSLELLKSVAEMGSIRRAAEAHGVSQPAASTRLRSLERVLGVTLIQRSTGRSTLTPEGQAVVEWAGPVIEGIRNLVLGASALREESRTRLRLAASMTVAEFLVPGWLTRLRSSSPDVGVSLQMGNSEQVSEWVRNCDAELGFVEGPDSPSGFDTKVVAEDRLVVVVARSHSWAKRRSPLLPNDLTGGSLVLREPGSGTREVFERAMIGLGLVPKPTLELASTTAIKAAVDSGSGPAVLSLLTVEQEIRSGKLVVIDVEQLDLRRYIRAIWSRTKQLSPAGKVLLGTATAPS